jgi:hypothetical protein
MNFIIRSSRVRDLAFAVTVFVVALAFRGYRLSEIQPHHDEAPLFGFGRGLYLQWEGSPVKFLDSLFDQASRLSEGDTPPVACMVAGLFRFLVGEDIFAARLFHAIIHSLGVAALAWLARRLFRPFWAPALAVSGLAVFSVVSILYGQFGEMYAISFFAGVAQYLVYWGILRRDWSWCGYLWFILTAYFCALFGYIQVWLTLGLLLASTLDRGGEGLRRIRTLRASAALLVYGVLNVIPFYDLLSRTTLKAGVRGYYLEYYPFHFLRERGGAELIDFVAYAVSRTYDLFNYHVSLVFDTKRYLPLSWNWVSLPFLVVLLSGVLIWLFRGGRRRSKGTAAVMTGVLAAFLLGNFLSLLPYGGIRNTLLLAPVFWLAYGAAVDQWNRWGLRSQLRRVFNVMLVLLPLMPFILSLPDFYRDRLYRLDLGLLEELIAEHRPDTLIMSESTYHPLRMIIQRYPDFQDQVIDRNGIRVTSFFEFADERWGHYPLPVPGEKVMAIDFYLPAYGEGVGDGVYIYHPSLADMSGPEWSFETLLEETGKNAGVSQHQSVYYPPNSVYIYLMRRDQ